MRGCVYCGSEKLDDWCHVCDDPLCAEHVYSYCYHHGTATCKACDYYGHGCSAGDDDWVDGCGQNGYVMHRGRKP